MLENGLVDYALSLKKEGIIRNFPDAPTERGVKHIHELIRAKQEGYGCGIA